MNINSQWREKLQKKHILLFLLFIFGAYAFMTSVLTRGEVLEQAPELALVEENTSIAVTPRPPLAPQILGDKLVAEESNKQNTAKKQFNSVLPQKTADIIVNQDGQVKIKTSESPKIVLGYKEGVQESWNICDNLSLAHSFGFDTANCQTESEIVASAPIAYSPSRGGGAGSVSPASGNNNSEDDSVTEPVDTPDETVIPDDENTDTEEADVLNTEALLASWIIGDQEMMGQIGDEPSSFAQLSVRPGILAEVENPYHFKGVSIKTTEEVNQVVVYVYNDDHAWLTWDLNYPEAIDSLANLVLTDDDVVLVKVVSEDLATTNWYKAKLFDGEYTPAQTPDFLKIFRVDGQDVLPLTGLEVDYRNINTVDFGANLLIDGFEDAVGVEVLLDDWSDFVKAKVYIYTGHWATWDLLYPGSLENLAQTSLTENSIVMLELEDQNGDSFFYRVNLIQGVIEQETEPVEMLSSDSSLKTLLLAKKDLLSLPGIYLGSEWSPSMTGAVLTVDSLENLEGLFPTANDETAKVKVSIFRDAWTTWENEIGLALLSKEDISFGDKIVVEVIAQDGTKSYYQVEIAKNLKVHENASPIDNLSNQELAKPEEELEEEIEVVKEIIKDVVEVDTNDVVENTDTTEVVTEISNTEKVETEKPETTEVLE